MSSPLRSIFFGTPDFAIPSLISCFENTQLLAVVSQPDKARGRKQLVSPSPVKEKSLELGLPVFTPNSFKNNDDEELKKLLTFISSNNVNLFVVTAFGKILPESFLKLASIGSINVHASLLPKWRGAAPIQRSLEAGDTTTGVCLQKMTKELDAGDVLSEAKIDVRASEGAQILTQKLSNLGGELLGNYLENLSKSQKLDGIQQDTSLVTFAKKIEKSEGEFKSSWNSSELINRMRAFEVWPNVRACVFLENKKLENPSFVILCAAEESSFNKSSVRAGEIVFENKKVFLKCFDKFVELQKVKAPGKGEAPAFVFFQNLLKQSGQQSIKLDNL